MGQSLAVIHSAERPTFFEGLPNVTLMPSPGTLKTRHDPLGIIEQNHPSIDFIFYLVKVIMAARRASRFWSKEEDDRLRRAVEQAGNVPILQLIYLIEYLRSRNCHFLIETGASDMINFNSFILLFNHI